MKVNACNTIFKRESKRQTEKLKCAIHVEGSKKRDLLNQIFCRRAIEDIFKR